RFRKVWQGSIPSSGHHDLSGGNSSVVPSADPPSQTRTVRETLPGAAAAAVSGAGSRARGAALRHASTQTTTPPTLQNTHETMPLPTSTRSRSARSLVADYWHLTPSHSLSSTSWATSRDYAEGVSN